MAKVCILSSVHQALDNRIFYREARSLQRAGHAVVVIAAHERDEVREGIAIRALPRVPRWQRPLLWGRLLRLARAERADLYHFHDPELLLVVPWLRWISGRPTVYDVHEEYADFIRIKGYLPAGLRRPLAWAFARLEPLAARLHSGLVLADERIAATFARVRRPQAVLFNYPERAFLEQGAAAAREEGHRPPVVVHVGGHERSRGVLLMVEAFAQVRQGVPDARLALVGPFFPPALEAEVRAEIARRGLGEAVTLAGRVPFADVGRFLQGAAVGWVALQAVQKYQKNIPTKLFEYMAYGLPVVTSDLEPVRPYVRDGENGWRVTAGDPAAHAAALIQLLQHPAEARTMGRRGQALVNERWSWSKMEPRLLALYEALLRRGA